jgi:hypothetical protein
MTRHHAQPQNIHVMGARSRVSRLCGATTGGFVRLNAEGQKWLKEFLASGGGLCPECAKLHEAELR